MELGAACDAKFFQSEYRATSFVGCHLHNRCARPAPSERCLPAWHERNQLRGHTRERHLLRKSILVLLAKSGKGAEWRGPGHRSELGDDGHEQPRLGQQWKDRLSGRSAVFHVSHHPESPTTRSPRMLREESAVVVGWPTRTISRSFSAGVKSALIFALYTDLLLLPVGSMSAQATMSVRATGLMPSHRVRLSTSTRTEQPLSLLSRCMRSTRVSRVRRSIRATT